MADPLLLDIGCGRGNDLHKWNELGVSRVVGIDNHQESLEEARVRMEKKGGRTKCEFVLGDVNEVGLCELVPDVYRGKIDIVTFNFAFHYVKNPLECVESVSRLLVAGGVFVGVCSDGDVISKNLDGVQRFEEGGVVVEAVGLNQYSFVLRGGDSNFYFEFRDVPCEYFVYKKSMLDMLERSGFGEICIRSLSTEASPWGKYYFSWFARKK